MFLIFSLGRPDVLPVDDLGLRAGVQKAYGLAELPGRAALEELAEPWRPYRSVATWYFWRSRGAVPQS
jgi:DNA-3-methyladenine glycosylase II